jgi:hypothetical protein
MEPIEPWEVFRPAQICLATVIPHYLTQHVSAMLVPEMAPAGMSLQFARTSLQFIPTSLIGALWLQFARAVDGSKSYKECEACGKWFDVSKYGSRADKKTCNGTCRKRLKRRIERERKSASFGTADLPQSR